MTRKNWINLVVLVLLVGGLIVAGGLSFYYADLPNHLSQHETLVMGQNTFTPGSTASVRVVVQDTHNGAPLEGAQIKIAMKGKSGPATDLYDGKTDKTGTANVSFKVPNPQSSDQTLVVETRSSLGSDTVERPVTVQRDYRVLLTSDKPIYQPGQIIHLRALALGTFDLQAAQKQDLEITIADGKGNKVFRKTLTTSDYGVAATDFELASEVNTGSYKITAKLGNTSSEKTVTVETYALPKFGLKLEPEKTFYLPGEKVRGKISANYFYGKPVAGGKVEIEGYTFDVQRNVALKIDGKTDEQGNYAFEFDLPKYLTGSELDKGGGRFYIRAAVTDLAEHTELANTSLPVARSPLTIDAVPEGGYLRPNVENILYVLTSYPDGSPAETTLKLTFLNDSNIKVDAATGAYGLAEVRRTPRSANQNVSIEARDKKGNVTTKQFNFQGQSSGETVLLRPEKPVYKVGEPMKLTLLTDKPTGTVYLDIVREKQVVSTRSVEMQAGKAEVVVDLTPELYGTLELHAYKLLSSGVTVRDTRMVVVDQAAGLKLALAAGQETYKPGDKGQLNVNVTGSDGKGAQAALGVAIVDESVFALAQQDPGFAKLYFLLEKQLLEPKYDLHGYSLPDLVNGKLDDPQLGAAVSQAAQASLAETVKKPFTFSLQANSHQDNVKKANDLKTSFFNGISALMAGLLGLIPLAMTVIAGYSLLRRKVLGRSLLLLIAIIVVLTLLVAVWPLGDNYSKTTGLPQRFQIAANQIFQGDEWLPLLAFVALIGLIGMIVSAALNRDGELGWQLGLILVYVAVFYVLYYASRHSSLSGSNAWTGWIIAGFLLLPLSFWLRVTGFAWLRQGWAAVATLAVAIFLLLGLPLSAMALNATGGNAQFEEGLIMDGAVRREMAMPGAVPAPMMAAAPTAAPAQKANEAAKGDAGTGGGPATTAAEPPRLRQYFPETMLWLPEAITQPDGSLKLDVPVADSITTWRVTALASTQDGRLGSATGPMRVFQDFFVDLDLPTSLTVGDEVSVPVGVFNYLPSEQTVRLELAKADWFELKDEGVKEIKIASNEISVVYFRIRAKAFGQQPFQVTALGSKMSDAIKKEVAVYPDGKQIRTTATDRLTVGQALTQTLKIPADAIAATPKLWVKIYPGMLSQVVDGLDNILRMPNGCFEQTSSTTYPNVLVLDYLKTTKQAAPEVQMKAEQYINLGYQRLTTFEVKGSGGFSLFGSEPADRMLTAYGLQEFSDMSRVHDVDPALVQRAAKWLLSQQESDGSWKNDRGLVHESTWQALGNDRLPVAAYITWSLVEAGFGNEAGTQKGLNYVREFQAQAKDPYALALVANALVSADLKAGSKLNSATEDALSRLAGLAQRDGDKAFWKSGVASFMGSQGLTGSIETTALASLAFQRADRFPELATGGLSYILKQKDSFGTWHNTQATVLALKALIQSVRSGGEKVNASVTVTLNGGQAKTLKVTPENFDVVQLLSFEDIAPNSDNKVEFKVEGQGNLMYQVASSYYLPWDVLGKYPDVAPAQDAVSIDVKYDRTQIAVNDTVNVTVSVSLNQKGARADSALVDLGLPPGFTVLSEDLDALIERSAKQGKDYKGAAIQRYEMTGRQILVYLTNLSQGQPLSFSYRLRAKFPLAVRSPASTAYDYYNPAVNGEKVPQGIEVK
jgi:uncharacterized protein YfaS (alpha-2-macroglobulin family)/ABC-type glycerol-3-phosphate transport system permease component